MAWYFNSKRDGAVLRKKQNKLNATDLFISLYKQSPLTNQSQILGDTLSPTIIQQIEGQQQDQETLPQQTQQLRMKQPSNMSLDQISQRDFITISKSQTLRKMPTGKYDIDQKPLNSFVSDILKRPPGAYKDKIKEDMNLPYIAFVKFHEQESRPVKPYELYQILHDKLSEIRMIQTYIFSKGSQEFKTDFSEREQQQMNLMAGTLTSFQAAQLQNQIVQKANKITKGGCFILQYQRYVKEQPPKFEVFKNKLTKQLEQKINQQLIKSLNCLINEQVQEQAKVLISFIESTVGIDIKRIQMKFISDIQGNIVFLGVRDDIVYLRRGQEYQISSTRTVDNDYDGYYKQKGQGYDDEFQGFGSTKIIKDFLPDWRSSKVQPVCFGNFCKFKIEQNEKYQSIVRSKNQNTNQNLKLIPARNKVLKNNVSFSIGALLIKKAVDNLEVTKIILQNNNIVGDFNSLIKNEQERQRSNSNFSKNSSPTKPLNKSYNAQNQYGYQSGSLVSQASTVRNQDQNMSNYNRPPRHLNKTIYADNYSSLYKAVSICQKCYVIYTILSEFLDSNDQSKIQRLLAQQEQTKEEDEERQQINQKNQSQQNSERRQSLNENQDQLISIQSQEQSKPVTKKTLQKKNVTMNFNQIDKQLGISQLMKKKTLMLNDMQHQNSENIMNSQQLKSILQANHRISLPLIRKFSLGKMKFNQTLQSSAFIKSNSLIRMDTQLIDQSIINLTRPTEITKIREPQKISYKINLQSQVKKNLISLKTNLLNIQSQSPSKSQINNSAMFTFSKPPISNVNLKAIKKKNQRILINNTSDKLVSMKQTMGLSLQFKDEKDDVFAGRGLRRKRNQLNIINFYYEVSKDTRKYSLRQHLNMKKSQKSLLTSSNQEFKSRLGSRQSSLDVSFEENLKIPKKVDYGEVIRKKINQMIAQHKAQEALTIVDSATLFKNRLQDALIKLAQSYIVNYQESKNSYKKNVILSSKTPGHKDSENKQLSFQASPKTNKNQGGSPANINHAQDNERHQNYNITSSFFHHTKIQHTMKTPFYRVSTPKVPIYNFEKNENDPHDDKFIIPFENYQSMKTENYCDLLKIDFQILRDASIFLVDENTSIIYQILSNQDSQQKRQIEESSLEKEQTFIILLDIFDDFLTKIQFFRDLLSKLPQRKVKILLLNLPGTRYSQYNLLRTNLNNKFYASCIDQLLFFLHSKSQLDFLTEQFSFIGFGNGANIAIQYAMQIKGMLNLKSILAFNAYGHIDKKLQGTFKNLIQNFQEQSTLKDQEYSNFYYYNMIYSSHNLDQNQQDILMYKTQTGSQNTNSNPSQSPIHKNNKYLKLTDINTPQIQSNYNLQGLSSTNKLQGYEKSQKISVLKGVLGNISLQDKLAQAFDVPLICIYSDKNCLVDLKHQEDLLNSNQNENLQSQLQDAHSNSQALQDSSQRNELYNKFQMGMKNNISELIIDDSMIYKKLLYKEKVKPIKVQKQKYPAFIQYQQGQKNLTLSKIVQDRVKRICLIIDGGHDVFVENPKMLQKILKEYINANALQ
eukprot:403365251